MFYRTPDFSSLFIVAMATAFSALRRRVKESLTSRSGGGRLIWRRGFKQTQYKSLLVLFIQLLVHLICIQFIPQQRPLFTPVWR